MAKKDKTIIEKLSKTELLNDNKTKEVLNDILYKAYHNTTNEEDIKVIGALSLKYELECADEIVSNVELEGFPLPF